MFHRQCVLNATLTVNFPNHCPSEDLYHFPYGLLHLITTYHCFEMPYMFASKIPRFLIWVPSLSFLVLFPPQTAFTLRHRLLGGQSSTGWYISTLFSPQPLLSWGNPINHVSTTIYQILSQMLSSLSKVSLSICSFLCMCVCVFWGKLMCVPQCLLNISRRYYMGTISFTCQKCFFDLSSSQTLGNGIISTHQPAPNPGVILECSLLYFPHSI